MPQRTWFTMAAKADQPEVADISIYDEIGYWGVTAANFRDSLAALGDVRTINLRINSPGGEVFDGLAVYNMLNRHPANIKVTVDGLAASIASVIAMAGDEVAMPENAMMMIHNPSGLVWGEAVDMLDMADTLDKIRQGIVTTYTSKSGQTPEDVITMLDAATWMTAAEAKEKGFADTVLPAKKMSAKFDLQRFGNEVPAEVAALFTAEASENSEEAAAAAAAAETTAAEAEATRAAAEEAEATRLAAEELAQAEAAASSGTAAAASEQTAAAATNTERERSAQISAACDIWGHADKAATFIESGKSPGEVFKELRALGRGRSAGSPPARANGEVSARHNPADGVEAAASWTKAIERTNARIH